MDVRKTGFSEYTNLEEAQNKILEESKLTDTEIVYFEKALDRVVSKDIKSEIDVPPFDRSAMDGYAVKAEDTFGTDEIDPVELKITGTVGIGENSERTLKKGEAIEIATGAPIPSGANATVMYEKTEKEGSQIKIFDSVSPGENVSPKGEDFEKGEIVIKKGTKLDPSHLGILGSTQNLQVEVFEKPKVAIGATGGELKKPGESLELGEITEINSFTVSGCVKRQGAEVEKIGIIPDDLERIMEVLEDISNYDIVILTGGSSVGEKDLVPLAIEKTGQMFFHGVGMRPGSPCAFGKVNGTLVFSFPGFPAATLMACENLLRPLLREMVGLDPFGYIVEVEGVLTRKVSSSLGRVDLVRVSIGDDGSEIEPLRVTGSSVLRSVSEADGILKVPENLEGFSKGERVRVNLIDL